MKVVGLHRVGMLRINAVGIRILYHIDGEARRRVGIGVHVQQ